MPEYIDKKMVLDILSNGGYPKQQLEEIEGLPVVETDQKPEKKSVRKKKKRLENAVPVSFVSPDAPSCQLPRPSADALEVGACDCPVV